MNNPLFPTVSGNYRKRSVIVIDSYVPSVNNHFFDGYFPVLFTQLSIEVHDFT